MASEPTAEERAAALTDELDAIRTPNEDTQIIGTKRCRIVAAIQHAEQAAYKKGWEAALAKCKEAAEIP